MALRLRLRLLGQAPTIGEDYKYGTKSQIKHSLQSDFIRGKLKLNYGDAGIPCPITLMAYGLLIIDDLLESGSDLRLEEYRVRV